MPEQEAKKRAKAKLKEGKAASTAAGEFVREEMHQLEKGKHRAKSKAQAVAIGLSKARRAGVPVPAPEKGESTEEIRKKAQRDLEKGQEGRTREAHS